MPSSATLAVRRIRATRPETPDHLWRWVRAFTGVSIARRRVCADHCSPFDAFAAQWLDRPPISLELGPRGGGKSFLAAIKTHLDSRFTPGFGTRILGGSAAQSGQIYDGLTEAVIDGRGVLGSDAGSIHRLLRQRGYYRNGSEVAILAASATSVRGPHVPSLRLDEVDEIDETLREDAIGIATEKVGGPAATVAMTSTWHKLGGEMEKLIGRAKAGEFPLYTFCAFEVLGRCPDDLSGPHLEHCPRCPLYQWCHSDRDVHPSGLPKAKRSRGHLTVAGLVQKATLLSKRAFEADYLCVGPRADGLWFKHFDESIHVSDTAEYDPRYDAHLAVDSGVFTGAVWFQVRPDAGGHLVTVFADYLSEGLSAEANARAILDVGLARCGGRLSRRVTDPAGGYRNPVGATVLGLYEGAGLRLTPWPVSSVSDGLELIESFLSPADGITRLHIHPRCKHLIAAFRGYRRAKRGGQWMDYPEDPCHPFEDLMDSLRGGLKDRYPEGRVPDRTFARRPAAGVF